MTSPLDLKDCASFAGPVQKRAQQGDAYQRGVSLVEVLVSIVLAAVGLLALAGLNAATIRYTKMSQYRATAAVLASDLGERMRGNYAAVKVAAVPGVTPAYEFTSSFSNQASAPTITDEQRCKMGLRIPGSSGQPSTRCTTTPVYVAGELPGLDLLQWRMLVRAQLPEGSAFIQRVTAAQPGADVWIAWRDPELKNADEAPKTKDADGNDIECPAGLNAPSDKPIRCVYFRINL